MKLILSKIILSSILLSQAISIKAQEDFTTENSYAEEESVKEKALMYWEISKDLANDKWEEAKQFANSKIEFAKKKLSEAKLWVKNNPKTTISVATNIILAGIIIYGGLKYKSKLEENNQLIMDKEYLTKQSNDFQIKLCTKSSEVISLTNTLSLKDKEFTNLNKNYNKLLNKNTALKENLKTKSFKVIRLLNNLDAVVKYFCGVNLKFKRFNKYNCKNYSD